VSAAASNAATPAITTGLTLNLEGLETVGDGSGTLITSTLAQYRHWLTQFAFQDWAAGAWLDAPIFPADPSPEDADILHMIDAGSFTLAETIAAARVTGGYVGAGVVGDGSAPLAIRDLITRWNQSCDVDSGFSRKTQFFVSMENDDPGQLVGSPGPAEYTQERDIFAGSFQIEDQDTELFTVRPYAYQLRDADGVWAVEGEARDDAAIAAMLNEERVAQRLELHFVREATVAADIVARALARSATMPRRVTWRTGLGGLSTELGDVILVTHADGIGLNGWTQYPLRVREHEINPDTFEVEIVATDQRHIFGGSPGA
jgi:hypothetical protein